MLDFSDSQLPEDELLERMAIEEASLEYAKWQERKRLKRAYEFRFVGGLT